MHLCLKFQQHYQLQMIKSNTHSIIFCFSIHCAMRLSLYFVCVSCVNFSHVSLQNENVRCSSERMIFFIKMLLLIILFFSFSCLSDVTRIRILCETSALRSLCLILIFFSLVLFVTITSVFVSFFVCLFVVSQNALGRSFFFLIRKIANYYLSNMIERKKRKINFQK
jgi:hypothetical protein